ncbi:T9SS type A sorting domain-containing protein [Flavobacterium sp.]|uniref:T9SS type A sorting domain-containing protein n=1 Tax=Flavobacterium sp. TaxID=239 RepID=UPI004033D843
MKKTIYIRASLMAMLLIFGFAANAQQGPKAFGRPLKQAPNPKNGLIRCVSTEYEAYLQENDPGRQSRGQFEEWMAVKIQAVKAQRMASPEGTTAIITIPVVVHVIHNGDAVGSGENIADAQVLSQITVLNQDYRRMAGTPGFNSNAVGADVEIEFCLAKIDPEGNATTGIDRVNLGVASWNSENSIENTLKPSTIWDPTQYFNIWVCSFGGNMTGILGYAQFPNAQQVPGVGNNNGGADTDGVVIGYRYFGSRNIYPQGNYQFPYDKGRTTTHEIGHALGLFHIDGDNATCTTNTSDSAKDYCPDTPVIYELNYECETIDSCPGSPGNDMIENYMDYTPDGCMNIFTQNQKTRIVAVMQYGARRASLKTSTVCQVTSGRDDFELLNGFNVYPNPTQGELSIASDNGNLPDSFTIYNSLGQTMASVKVSGTSNLNVNTSAYANGLYFIKLDKGSQSKTIKFIKN